MNIARTLVFFLVLVVFLIGGAFWLRSAYFGGGSAPEELLFRPANSLGDPLFGVFEGRAPCGAEDCSALKIGLALYRDDVTWVPTTYRLVLVYVGPGDEQHASEGAWTVEGDVEGYPDSVVYALDANAPAELRSYWAINDDLLLILGKKGRPRVGNAGLGYLLNRTQ